MRILILSHRFHPDVGGIEGNSELLANYFSLAGHEVRVATWSTSHEPDSFDYAVYRNPSAAVLVKCHRWADVIFENQVCLRLVWPAAVLRKPTVTAINTWISRCDGSLAIQDRIKLSWLSRVNSVIAVSESVRRKCWPNAITIGNPYHHELFQLLPGVRRDRDFAFLGRLVSDKGVDLAIRALARLNHDCDAASSLTLSIIGDGPERGQLEQLVNHLGLASVVTFTGVLRGVDLVHMLNRHRFLWVPSRWEEPFGNVALEGMACGCIPIVSDGGGLPDAVGEAGVLFVRNSLEDLIEQTKRLLNDLERQSELIARASDHLSEHKPSVVARRYLGIIEAAVSLSRSKR